MTSSALRSLQGREMADAGEPLQGDLNEEIVQAVGPLRWEDRVELGWHPFRIGHSPDVDSIAAQVSEAVVMALQRRTTDRLTPTHQSM